MFESLSPPYDVVVIDPAWHYTTWSRGGEKKSPQAQYRTMRPEEIMALPVRDLLARDGALFLLTTWPILARGDAHDALRAWGLSGRSGGAWVKRTANGKLAFGTGYIWRSACEPIIVATRRTIASKGGVKLKGASTRNLVETFEEFALDGVRRGHSVKPDELYQLIETLTPGMRRADIFARRSRPGWDSWGDEKTKHDPPRSRR